jgi:hypothetical protein
MSFGWKTPGQRPGEMIPAHALNKVYEAVGNLLRMSVGRGLKIAWVRGAPSIQLEGDFNLYDVKTTSSWSARSGAQYGTGKFKFQAIDLSGLTSDAGLHEYDGFSLLPTMVATGKYGVVAKISGSWRLVAVEC